MTSPDSVGSADETGAMQAPEFQILILSENAHVLCRAMHVCDRLMTRFENSFAYRIAIATFAALEKAGQFQEALQAARTADMIFVVSDNALSATSLDWLQTCVRQHEDVSFAIADMTKHGAIDAGALRQCSISGSRQSSVDVIREQPCWLCPLDPSVTSARLASHDCSNHWGINE